MKYSIEKAVRDIGAIRIENIIGIGASVNINGLYPEDYDTDASHFLYPNERQNLVNRKQGGMHNAKKKRSASP